MIWPAFVVPGEGVREPIDSMPGQERLSIDQLIADVAQLVERGIFCSLALLNRMKRMRVARLPSPRRAWYSRRCVH